MGKSGLDKALTVRGLQYEGTVAHAISASLARHGVKYLFGQSLPSMLHLTANAYGISQIAYRQENTGGYMADGYARVSNQVGVVTAQNGPAAALLVAPLAEALKVSVPLVALVQDVNRDQTDKNAFQELDHESMFRPVTKWVRRVTEASRIDDYIDMAITAATSGRPGPVALLLPADLLTEQMPPAPIERTSSLGHYPIDRLTPADELITQAAELLANAEAPIVIAGGGVHLSGAAEELERLQENAHLPVATTVMGKGSTDEGHKLSVGVASYFMGKNGCARYMRDLITEADVVLLIGNRTNQNGTDSWTLYPQNAKYIHIDIDPLEIGRNYDTAVRLLGDARTILEKLNQTFKSLDLSKRQERRSLVEQKIAEGKAKHRKEVESLVKSENTPIRPERVMHEIDKRLDDSTIVAADASYSSIWVANYMYSRKAGMRFITPRGLAGLGWGFPMALGAKVAQPDSAVICVVGDGGFAHSWAEIETSVRMKLPIVTVVLNNGILGYQRHAENIKFGIHSDACEFAPVDHAKLAQSIGAQGVRISEAAELGDAIEKALTSQVTTVIDVVTDPDAYPPVTWYKSE